MAGYDIAASLVFGLNTTASTPGSVAGGAEVTAYDPIRKLSLVMGPNGVDAIDAATGAIRFGIPKTAVLAPDGTGPLALGSANSIAVKGDILAIALDGPAAATNGAVAFFQMNAAGTGATWLRTVTVDPASTPGRVTFAVPDMVTFTPDGTTLLVAIEGEPASNYSVDPEGGIGVIDVATGSLQIAGFGAFDAQKTALKAAGVRLNAPSAGATPVAGAATVSQDLEPEYITVSADGGTAYVTLQEANAIAVVSLAGTPSVTAILPMGLKDWNQPGGPRLDPTDQDGGVRFANWPIQALYMPDAIASFAWGGKTYLVTANEGDWREYSAFTDVIRAGNAGYALDPGTFPDAATLKQAAALGRLNVSRTDGDTDNDGDYDVIVTGGGRSLSIWAVEGDRLVRTWDSADILDKALTQLSPPRYDDGRSDDKGSEPEHVTLGRIGDTLFAFVGLERTSAPSSVVMAFQIDSPTDVSFAGSIVTTGTGSQQPEAFTFVPQADAPGAVAQPLLVIPNESAGNVREVSVSTTYTLQILHASDFEAGVEAVRRAPNFAAVVDALAPQYANTLILSSGDNFIPGPFTAAGTDPSVRPALAAFYEQLFGLANGSLAGIRNGTLPFNALDIAVLNAIGVQASVLGNHDFDLGPSALAAAFDFTTSGGNALSNITNIGAQFPYLSANLNFAREGALSGLFTGDLRDINTYRTTAADLATLAGIAAEAAGRELSPWSTATVNGEVIGILGVTTQILAAISSIGNVQVLDPAGDGGVDNMDELASILQPYVDQMQAQGIDKIVLLSHLQLNQNELLLATRLSGVDVIIAGGSHELFADATDPIEPGTTATNSYPVIRTGADGKPVLVVNTSANYTDVGRLVVGFDASGVIDLSSIDPAVSGAYITSDAGMDRVAGDNDGVLSAAERATIFADGTRAGEVQQLVAPVAEVIRVKDGNVLGFSDVFLEGRRNFVRGQETNLGDLTADANLAVAKSYDLTTLVSVKNGGGIRAEIGRLGVGATPELLPTAANPEAGKPAGGISQLDIENSLRFNNALSLVTLTRQGILNLVENGLAQAGPGLTPGAFPQISGLAFSWDPTRPALDRVKSLVITDQQNNVVDVIARDYSLVGGATDTVRIVTLNFIAPANAAATGGGDNLIVRGATVSDTAAGLVNGRLAVYSDYAALNRVDLYEGSVTGFTSVGSEQAAFADYLRAVHGTPATAFRTAETSPALDARVQTLSARADGLAGVTAVANAGNDLIVGTSASQSVSSGAGNDTIASSGGNDTIDGGAGFDVAAFSVARATATVARSGPGSWTVATPDGTSQLTGIEQVRFADGSLYTTSQTPYIVSSQPNVRFGSVLSVGDVAGTKANGDPWRLVGIPDGLGAFDNGDGTITVLVNHEIGATAGVVRDHGSAGAFVSALVIDKATLAVVSGSDLAKTMYLWDGTGYTQATSALARLCSADLPPISAFYDAASGLGTTARVYMNGEESGAEGRAFAWVASGAEAGTVWQLPKLGRFSWENSVANASTGSKTVVIGTDDASGGQVYVYIGDKQATGTTIERAGLTNGQLYGIRADFAAEASSGQSLTGSFSLAALGDVANTSGAALQTASVTAGVTGWLRPEDGAWDTLNPNRFYFVTTNAFNAPSRLWALDFADARDPAKGGTYTALLDGTEGQQMFDNITVSADGTLILLEDVGNQPRSGRVYHYDPKTDILTQVAAYDVARFGNENTPATAPFTQDEEASGVIDVTDLLGSASTRAFLLDTQAHYPFGAAGSADRTELVEGGQLQVMYIDTLVTGTAGNDNLTGTFVGETIEALGGNDTGLGGGGGDSIAGGEGNDSLDGGVGDDLLDGGPGRDTLLGAAGDDTLVGTGGGEMIDGGSGTDLLRFAASGQGVVSLVAAGSGDWAIRQGAATEATVRNVERIDVTGGPLGDRLDAAALSGGATLLGGAGNDTLIGGAGDDRLVTGNGLDRLVGGGGADAFVLAPANATPGLLVDTRTTIADFVSGTDRIEILLLAFDATEGLRLGSLADQPGRFAANSTGLATGAGPQFVFETDVRALWWDLDGTGPAARQLLASLPAAQLVAGDIWLV
ncbi:choice-of-anchor I family protein [Paracraurococcus ruber]|uniref:5'-nucleotidase n=1 Tax=Paracraurococcus ruber TaxID=77675 RepID=A0ABS1D0L0_9PROT|nr:choice-of-anchor I family protein [Paracraurococcus ruber]MBK1659642.1 hypothetical protein [Paracraurococcus ruber]TDG29305.1 DUF839 domain-containing protein [Paracraurococcus ruber]